MARSAAGRKPPSAPGDPGHGRDDDEPERPIEDRILSPRDLAAAFSLDFDARRPPETSRRNIGRLVATWLIVGLLASTLVVLAVPGLRSIVEYKFNRTYRDLVVQQGDPTVAPLVTPPPSPPSNIRPGSAVAAPAQAADGATSGTPNPTTPSTGDAGGNNPTVGATNSHPAPSPGDNTPSPQPGPAQTFTDLTPTVTYPTVPGSTGADRSNVKATATDFDTSRTLYRAGIDAESRHDYITAAKDYEAIEELPIEAWPGDIKIRLADVRKNLNK
jgi:hypothetical protein